MHRERIFLEATMLILALLMMVSYCRGLTVSDNVCDGGSTGFADCASVKSTDAGATTGVYNISVGCSDATCCMEVYCEMDIKGGGWTVFQRRFDGSVEFHRNWNDYVNGFGAKTNEHWLGLEPIHIMTQSGGPYDLLLKVSEENYPNCLRYQVYNNFTVGDSASEYTLRLGDYRQGNLNQTPACNPLGILYQKDQKFSTYDRDNDQTGSNCAGFYYVGWWFNSCHMTMLNGIYAPNCVGAAMGIMVRPSGCNKFAYAGSMMMFRPNSFPDAPGQNLCVDTDMPACIAQPAPTGYSARKCGPWGEWGAWSSCLDPTECGRWRSRAKIWRYEQYSNEKCLDGSDPSELRHNIGSCTENCMDTTCQAFSYRSGVRLIEGIQNTTGGTGFTNCAQICIETPNCKGFQFNSTALKCDFVSDSFSTIESDLADVFLYTL